MKKKLFIASLVSIIIIAISSSVVFGYFTYLNLAKTSGKVKTDSFFESKTEDTTTNTVTYEIKTANQLLAFSYLQNKGTFNDTTTNYVFNVSQDINMANKTIEPIGTSTYPFEGEFNGQGHVISKVVINSNYRGTGFFGVTAGFSEENTASTTLSYIHNFILEDTTINCGVLKEELSYETDSYVGFAVGVLNGKASSIGIRGGKIEYTGKFKTYSSIIGKLNGSLGSQLAGDSTEGDIGAGDTGIVYADKTNSTIDTDLTSGAEFTLGGENSIFKLHPGPKTGKIPTYEPVTNAYNDDTNSTRTSYDTFYLATYSASGTQSYLKYKLTGTPSIVDGEEVQDGIDYPYYPSENGFTFNVTNKDLTTISTQMKIIDNDGNNITSFNNEFRFNTKSSSSGSYIKFKTTRNNAYIFFLANSNGSRDVGLYLETTLKENDFKFEDVTPEQTFNIHTDSTSKKNILTGFLFSIPEAGTYYIGSTKSGMDFCYIAVESAGEASNGFTSPTTGTDENPVHVSAIDFIYEGISLTDENFDYTFVSSKVRLELEYTILDIEAAQTVTYVRTLESGLKITLDEMYLTLKVNGTGSVYVNDETTPRNGLSASTTT